MQYRSPTARSVIEYVPQVGTAFAQVTSVRTMPDRDRVCLNTLAARGSQNDGQPEPESYLVLDSKSSLPQRRRRRPRSPCCAAAGR